MSPPAGRAARRRAAERRGRLAESAALGLLFLKGYRPLGRRVRTSHGELDAVVRRGQTLVFVEVKARERMDQAAWAVTPRQQMRIARAARWWLAANPAFGHHTVRFDVVLVVRHLPRRHLVNAFEAWS